MTDGPPNHVLPPVSTTKVSLHEQAAGFFAQRRSGASLSEPARPPAPEAVRQVYDDAIEKEVYQRPLTLPATAQRYTLSQLVERLQASRAHAKAVREGADPDGPEDVTGWDPRTAAVPQRGAALAAGVLAHQRRPR